MFAKKGLIQHLTDGDQFWLQFWPMSRQFLFGILIQMHRQPRVITRAPIKTRKISTLKTRLGDQTGLRLFRRRRFGCNQGIIPKTVLVAR